MPARNVWYVSRAYHVLVIGMDQAASNVFDNASHCNAKIVFTVFPKNAMTNVENAKIASVTQSLLYHVKLVRIVKLAYNSLVIQLPFRNIKIMIDSYFNV